MSLNRLTFTDMLTFLHVIGLDEPSTIRKDNILSILTHWNRTYTNLIVTQNRNSSFTTNYIPYPKISSLIPW